MKMKALMLEAGSIILWKKYGTLTKLWNKITRTELPYNKHTLILEKTEMLTFGKVKNMLAYEPVRKYNKQEILKLGVLTNNGRNIPNDWLEISCIANIIRPDTFTDNGNVTVSKYYRKVECNEKLDEYIY